MIKLRTLNLLLSGRLSMTVMGQLGSTHVVLSNSYNIVIYES
jgi:hypothetical protein